MAPRSQEENLSDDGRLIAEAPPGTRITRTQVGEAGRVVVVEAIGRCVVASSAAVRLRITRWVYAARPAAAGRRRLVKGAARDRRRTPLRPAVAGLSRRRKPRNVSGHQICNGFVALKQHGSIGSLARAARVGPSRLNSVHSPNKAEGRHPCQTS